MSEANETSVFGTIIKDAYANETLTSIMGKKVFLPKYISYHWTIILIVMIMLLYYLVTSWNEKTRAFI